MQNLIIKGALALLLTIVMSSCKNYSFQKVVINNSDRDIVVLHDCCGNETEFIIPAHEEQVVFACTYQSAKKPDCSSVEGQFSWSYVEQSDTNDSDKAPLKDITTSDSWVFNADGMDLSCVFTIE